MGFGIGGRVVSEFVVLLLRAREFHSCQFELRFEFSDYFVFLEDFSIVGFAVGGGVVFGSC